MEEMKNTTPVTEPVAEKKNPSRRRLFTVLIALLVALSLLTATFAVLTFVDFDKKGDSTGGGNQETAFDYFGTDLSTYIALTEAMVKGLLLPGYDSRVDEVTPENVEKYINRILLTAVGLTDDEITQRSYSDSVKWSEPIDYADDVFLYIIRVEKKNVSGDYETVSVPYFENSYMDPGHLQIGMAYFGESFDEALLGLIPMETGYETYTSGTATKDDVILITYTATETVKATEEGKADTVKNHKNFQGQRLDLSKVEDTAWRDALLASGGATVGQYFSFEYEEDVNDDGTKEKLKYEGVIDGIIYNERTKAIDATLPEGFFGEDPEDETLASLNGAELRFHVSIDHTVPHEANTVDTMTAADIDAINTFLSEGGALTFISSNQSDISKLTSAIATLDTEIKKLEGEIQILEKRDIVKLAAEIADLEDAIASLDPVADEKEIAAKQANLDLKEASLTKKEEDLVKKQEDLGKKTTERDGKKADLETALVKARTECEEFFEKELKDSYEETVRMTKGQLVYEHLVKTLTFTSLPESEVEAMEEMAKEYVEYYYSQLSASEKRNYRDIEAFAAAYFGYDEKDYDGYLHYIETYLAPYEIKSQLLLPAIYNAFINDESKLNAKIDAHVADLMEIQEAAGQPMTRDEILKNYETNAGKDYLRNYYALPLVVYDFLAANNEVDFEMKAN